MHRGTFVVAVVWFAWACTLLSQTNNEAEPIKLSEQERTFILKHKAPIRIGITPEWAPFSYFDANGNGRGIDVDVLNIVTKKTGLRFQTIPGAPPWEEIWRMAEAGEVDLTTSTVETSDRERVFRFSKPYAHSLTVIVSRGGDLRFRHISLLKHATLAQPSNHLVTIQLREKLPAAKIIYLANERQCFEAVAKGDADAMASNLYTATQYMNDHPEMRLGIAGVISEMDYPLRMAVRRDYPELVEIINKVLGTISRKEMDEIESRHLLFTLQAGRRVALLRKRIFAIAAGAVAITSLILVWNCLIRKEVLARRAAEAELRDINRSLEVFSHSIAHDLKAPLRAINGLTEAMQQDYGEKFDQTGKDYLNRIRGAAERMDALVHDVLAFTQASRAEFKIENVSLKQVVFQLLGEYPPEQRGHFHVVSELPTVRGHPALLAQCLANLFSNAIKFIPTNRIPNIRVWSAQCESARIKLFVEDNGIGIPHEDYERIFKLFQQGTHKFGGTGIGLAVVAKGVERMGGAVGVESEPDEGSRFWIELNTAT